MTDLYPGAVWHPSVISHPTRAETRGVVIHNTYGVFDGDVATLDGPTVDVHFYVPKRGGVLQFLDPDSMSWTAYATANRTCVHIECEGRREVAWTPAQFADVVRLCAWLCRRYSIPVRKVDPETPADSPGWHGLFDHRDLSSIDGNDHGDGVPPSWPGWSRLIAAVRAEAEGTADDRRTLAQRLEDSGLGPKTVHSILRTLGHLPPGWEGTPTPQDHHLFQRLRVDGGLGATSARQVIYARRFLMQAAAA